jgi:hypothetical protein
MAEGEAYYIRHSLESTTRLLAVWQLCIADYMAAPRPEEVPIADPYSTCALHIRDHVGNKEPPNSKFAIQMSPLARPCSN